MNELRIIVAGSRDFNDYQLLSDTLMQYLNSIEYSSTQIKFVSGAARGADTLGEQFAYTYGYEVKRFPADWDNLGKRAGYVRNAIMAEYASEKTGVLFAFWDGKSKGTKHMIDLAKKHNLEVHVINY